MKPATMMRPVPLLVAIVLISIVPLRFESDISFAGSRSREASASITIGPNFRIYPSKSTQTETFITHHPSNLNILFACAHTINPNTLFVSEGVYVSTNGGTSWYGSDTCRGGLITVHGGEPGITIDKEGRFLLIRYGFFPGLYSHYSTDTGVSWSGQYTVASGDQDRAMLASDVFPSSSLYGRSYAVWAQFAPPYPVFFSFTDDGARTWSVPSQINNPSQRCLGGRVAVGPNGVVHTCWATVISTSPFTENSVGFATSTNGGANWNVIEHAFDMNGIAGVFSSKTNIRVNGLPRIDLDKSGGQRNGWIYVVTTQKYLAPAGTDPDIILNRSTDGGKTWSSGIRVNQDPLNTGKLQYFPTVHVDDGGAVNVLYYDDRTTTSDSAGVYLSRSTDGGNTWRDFQISDHNFKPLPVSGLSQGYQGDNIGLTSVRDTLWPVWMDNSTGLYQLWASQVRISVLGTYVRETQIPQAFELKYNYPNPFNSSTIIKYRLTKSEFITLKVFDLRGEVVAELVNEWQKAGDYTIAFESGGLSLASGIYFYQLAGSDFSRTRSMLLLK